MARGIPVSISPFFWLTAGLIGWINTFSFVGTLIWIAIIFVSILVHEFGHALTSRAFGQHPRIQLIAFGGLTYPEGPKISRFKEFIVVLNGPLFGFLLFLLGFTLLKLNVFTNTLAIATVQTFTIVNLFWTVVNLLPVLPLDGGQLLRIICESIFGVKGWKYALYGSIGVAIAIALGAFLYRQLFIGALFFLFAFQNIDTLRRTKHLSEVDRDDTIKDELRETELMIDQGRIEEAIPRLESIRARAKKGMIYIFTTEYLARLQARQGMQKEPYELLLSIQKHLSPESIIILHHLAGDMKDYHLVSKLAARTFQYEPTYEVAALNATAAATEDKVTATIGWLQAAVDAGLPNIQELTSKEPFTKLQGHPTYQKFLTRIQS